MNSRLIMNLIAVIVFLSGCAGITMSPLNLYVQTPWIASAIIGILLIYVANIPPQVIEIRVPDTNKYDNFIDTLNTRMEHALTTGIAPTGRYDRETSITKLDTAPMETPKERCERLNRLYPQCDHLEGVYDKETKTTVWKSHSHPLRENHEKN